MKCWTSPGKSPLRREPFADSDANERPVALDHQEPVPGKNDSPRSGVGRLSEALSGSPNAVGATCFNDRLYRGSVPRALATGCAGCLRRARQRWSVPEVCTASLSHGLRRRSAQFGASLFSALFWDGSDSGSGSGCGSGSGAAQLEAVPGTEPRGVVGIVV
jgi:hypothetical protein